MSPKRIELILSSSLQFLDFFLPHLRKESQASLLRFRMRLLVAVCLLSSVHLFYGLFAWTTPPDHQFVYLGLGLIGVLTLIGLRMLPFYNTMSFFYLSCLSLLILLMFSKLELSLVRYLQWSVPAIVFTTLMLPGIWGGIFLLWICVLTWSILKFWGLELISLEMAQYLPGDLFVYMSFGLLANGFVLLTLLAFESKRQNLENRRDRESDLLAKNLQKAAVSELVGNFAHEINNPLAIVQSSIHQLRRLAEKGQLDDPRAQRLLVYIQLSIRRIEAMQRHLSHFASGYTHEEATPISVDQIFKNLIDLYAEKLKDAGISLKTINHIGSKRFPVRINSLNFVLGSLVQNSFEAMLYSQCLGQISLTANLENGRLCFLIDDNGPGLVDEKAIFEPFYSTKKRDQHSGLSLSVCRRIMLEQEAELRIATPQPDRGARFVLRLKSGVSI